GEAHLLVLQPPQDEGEVALLCETPDLVFGSGRRSFGRPAASEGQGGGGGAEGSHGGLRGSERRQLPSVLGSGVVLQSPAVWGAVEGLGGGVRVQPPRRNHHPLPGLRVRERSDPGRRRRSWLPEVGDVEENLSI
ncbi:hypothetical protein U1Q18_023386, partial [Sarracenia purpurea var. burkii]